MEVAAGALMPLLGKLGELLAGEYKLHQRVREDVESLRTELGMIHATLRKVGDVPPEQLDEQVRIWAGKVRELSYNMEDAVDGFLVRVEDCNDVHGPTNMKNRVKKFLKKTTKLFSKGKALHQLSDAIEEAQKLAMKLGDMRQRYMFDVRANGTEDTIDPRLKAVYKDVADLVGIDNTRDEVIRKLSDGDEEFKQQLKTMSIVGFGGLGKTTLARAVYDKIKVQFDCGAFVSVSQKPDMKKIFKKILYELDEQEYKSINEALRDEEQLLREMKRFLHNKRYLIVIDDIWDKKVWEIIKCAFSNSTLGSRLMTTTRIVDVAQACCSSGDMIYNMKPLSEDDSKNLFYKRIFSQGSGCPHELEQVSKDILKKCGGVPLAIITIASILASDKKVKRKDQWETLLKSIGRGLTEDPSVAEMQKILSFSYYNLPSYLKTCLLYLSIFPEDYEIRRDRLIWRWIAEGFVQGGRQETGSLFELGESYFSELVNRNMIQAVDVDIEGKAWRCRVHDMVLDLICSLCRKENFVTVLDGTEQSTSNSENKVRRLSIQNSMSELTDPRVNTTSMSQVRSVTLFRTIVDLIESFSYFQVLRVLDLEGCDLRKSNHKVDLRFIENLLHLRYLGLSYTDVGDLPIEIGKLRFLETLDLRQTGLEVPSSVVRLRHLMCLHVDMDTQMPVGMGNMVSLEELTRVKVGDSHEIVKELGSLIKLRMVDLLWEGEDETMCNSLAVSLGKLQKLQNLSIMHDCRSVTNTTRFDASWDGWVPPPHLRTLVFYRCTSRLPRWINSSSLLLLSYLDIEVDEVRGKDIQILGKLPALCFLWLRTTKRQYTRVEKCIIDADVFPCVRECGFWTFTTAPCMFPRGSMPKLEHLWFEARALDVGSGEVDVGMAHLPSLHRVDVWLWTEKDGGSSSKKLEEAKAALRLAADTHPNRPLTLDIRDCEAKIDFDEGSEEEEVQECSPAGSD